MGETMKKWRTGWRPWMPAVVVLTCLPLLGFFHATLKVNPESEKLAKNLPIADLHLHPSEGTSPAEVKSWMDATGVKWAGAGVRRGSHSTWMAFSRELGNRFIAFAGQSELNRAFYKGGEVAMEDAENPIVKELLRQSEEDLKAGRIKGIGEIFINNDRSTGRDRSRRTIQTDAPSIRRLYELVSRYNGFLTFHMDNDSDSVAGLERILKSDRKGRVLWNHCGSHSDASEIEPLLERHPNLFCELAFRFPPVLRDRLVDRNPSRQIFDESGPDADWLKLIEEFPDRFMLGTDAKSEQDYDGAISTARKGLLPYLKPLTARKVAYENAQHLFGLK